MNKFQMNQTGTDMGEQPLISVIIPTYNEAPTIGVAIQSMTDQTYRNLEILVIDDGSTDNTENIVKEFARKDPRVRYLKCPHKDPHRVDCRGTNISVGYLARNYGMEQSRGEWITFQDADDASLLNRIEMQYRLAVRHNATCVTTSSFPFKEELLGKSLDVERILKEEKNIIIRPEKIVELAKKARGILMRKWFPHNFVPFTFKKRAPTRYLFIASLESYPGVDGAPLFKRETIQTVRFRQRDQRIWPAKSGRGAGRDHLLHMAETFKNSYSFRLPLYLWRTKDKHDPYPGWEKYLI